MNTETLDKFYKDMLDIRLRMDQITARYAGNHSTNLDFAQMTFDFSYQGLKSAKANMEYALKILMEYRDQRLPVVNPEPVLRYQERSWTEYDVRRELPIVKVKRPDGTTFLAQVRGRALNNAVVINIENNNERAEVAWKTLASVLTGNRFVIL